MLGRFHAGEIALNYDPIHGPDYLSQSNPEIRIRSGLLEGRDPATITDDTLLSKKYGLTVNECFRDRSAKS